MITTPITKDNAASWHRHVRNCAIIGMVGCGLTLVTIALFVAAHI